MTLEIGKDETSGEIDQLMLSVVNSVTSHHFDAIPEAMTVQSLGLDSLAFSQLILEFETRFGEMSEKSIDQIVIARTVGEIRRVLSEAANTE